MAFTLLLVLSVPAPTPNYKQYEVVHVYTTVRNYNQCILVYVRAAHTRKIVILEFNSKDYRFIDGDTGELLPLTNVFWAKKAKQLRVFRNRSKQITKVEMIRQSD